MKDTVRSRFLLLLPVCCLALCHQPAQASSLGVGKPDKLLAQADSSGTITPEKIRRVVEMKLRANWRPVNAADGTSTVVRFAIATSGSLSGTPAVKTSCGVPDFDNSCLDAINKIGSLPALPAYLNVSEVPFIGKFHAGKSAFLELKLEEDYVADNNSGGGGNTPLPPTNGGPPTGPSGANQSGWTTPSSAATGQSEWTMPSGSSSGQSGWTQPSGSVQQPTVPPQQAELSAAPDSLSAPPAMAFKQQQPPSKPPTGATAKQSTPPRSTQQNVPPGQMQQQGQMQPPVQQTGEDLNQRVVLLNNNAVVAIADNNYEVAIKKLEEALKIDPTYQQARANLAIAYNNYGLQLKDRPEEAIKIFHKAIALDPGNDKTKINLDTIIQYLGKNPKVFKDRLDLGNTAFSHGDTVGAKIEYEAALAIKQDPIVQQKLYALKSGTSPNGTPDDPNRHRGIPQTKQTAPPAKAMARPAATAPAAISITSIKPPFGQQNNSPPRGNNNGNPAMSDGTTDGAPVGGVSQKLDNMYRNLKNLEVKTFGKPFESDDILSRLARLEQKLLGKVQQGKPMRRLDALLILQ